MNMSNLANIRDRWLDPPANDWQECDGCCNRLTDSSDMMQANHKLFCPACWEEWLEEQPQEEDE